MKREKRERNRQTDSERHIILAISLICDENGRTQNLMIMDLRSFALVTAIKIMQSINTNTLPLLVHCQRKLVHIVTAQNKRPNKRQWRNRSLEE